MAHPFRAPSVVTYISACERRARKCPDFKLLVIRLWDQGKDTAEIAATINSHGRGEWLVTEAEVVRALMALRAGKVSQS